MTIFDKAYKDIRTKYVVPLSRYSVPYNKLRTVNIKEILRNKWRSVEERSAGEYVFHFDEEDLLKGILGDIELFYIRQMIHQYDTERVFSAEVSANWEIVTYYYDAFFSASLLLRLFHRGNIFLDETLRHELDRLISTVLGKAIRLESNQFYEVLIEREEFVLKLSTSKKVNTHELVWIEMDKLIDEMKLLSRTGSKEFDFLDCLKKVNGCLTSTYPSKLRNRVNYQPVYGLNYLDKRLLLMNQRVSWISVIEGFSGSMDDNNIANMMHAYTEYIEIFSNNLIAEYFNMKGNKDSFLSRVNKDRTNPIAEHKICYSFKK